MFFEVMDYSLFPLFYSGYPAERQYTAGEMEQQYYNMSGTVCKKDNEKDNRRRKNS